MTENQSAAWKLSRHAKCAEAWMMMHASLYDVQKHLMNNWGPVATNRQRAGKG